MSDCTFCRIVRGAAAAPVVYQDAACLAFLDHRPLFVGHTLVVPREHHETLGALPDALLAPFFSTVRRLSLAVEEGLGADGSFVAINNRVSQSVPHLHAHVIPRRRKDGLHGFFWPRQKYESDEAMCRVQDAIAAAAARANV